MELSRTTSPDAQNLIYLVPVAGDGGGSPAPEPSTVVLFAVGMAGLWALRRRTLAA